MALNGRMTDEQSTGKDMKTKKELVSCLFVTSYTHNYHHKRCIILYKKVNQSHYRPEVPREFHEVEVPRLRDDG